MGSITPLVLLPFGSVDIILSGLIDSVTNTVNSLVLAFTSAS
ncbi:hypothetical protein ABH922_001543 [Rhodococcus sp. 27YEA15]